MIKIRDTLVCFGGLCEKLVEESDALVKNEIAEHQEKVRQNEGVAENEEYGQKQGEKFLGRTNATMREMNHTIVILVKRSEVG